MSRVVPKSPIALARARSFRRFPTDAERLLWALLRRRQLSGHRFRRQHPINEVILDFYCPGAALAVEIDGVHHDEERQREYDEQRTRFLADRGIQVLRFTNREVFSDTERVLAAIASACAGRTR